MRWKKRYWEEGDMRVRSVFAWLPIRGRMNPGDTHFETRWLERVTIQERYSGWWWERPWFVDNFNSTRAETDERENKDA